MLNPTSKAYSFKWTCENTGACPFRCLTPSGTLQPGKKVEVRVETNKVFVRLPSLSQHSCESVFFLFLFCVCLQLCFEYVPEQIDLVAQSSWSFVIDSLSMSVPFICIGTSREPLIYFSKPYVEFGELLVGTLERRRLHQCHRVPAQTQLEFL